MSVKYNRKNIVILETKFAKYKIIYGIHQIEQSPEILANSDGLIIEGIGDFFNTKKVEEFIKAIEKSPQHGKLIGYCRENGKSVYLVDLNKLVSINGSFFTFVESLGGFVIGASVVNNCVKRTLKLKNNTGGNPHLSSRRNFFRKIWTGTKVTASAFLLSPILGEKFAKLIGQPEEGSITRTIDRLLIHTNENIHPEIFWKIITFRNNLIAQKAEYVAKLIKNETRKKPNLSILIGSAHVGIEDSLVNTEEKRLQVIGEGIEDDKGLRQPLVVKVDFIQGVVSASFMEEEGIAGI
jgi:hypothetical protein